MTDTTTLEARLAEAEDALHAVLVGRRTVSVRDASGRQVQYGPADAPTLRAYVRELKAALGRAPRRAVGIGFGGPR